MNEKREQPKYVRPLSLNEVERKREVDRLNFENQLMASRLNKVASVINNSHFEKDFKRHLKAESNLRRKQMKPLAVPKDLHPNSPLRNKTSSEQNDFQCDSSSLFDIGLYTSQRGQHLQGKNIDNLGFGGYDQQDKDSSIRSVTDFRKQIIAPKKLIGSGHSDGNNRSHSSHIDRPQHLHSTRNESLYEVTYIPS